MHKLKDNLRNKYLENCIIFTMLSVNWSIGPLSYSTTTSQYLYHCVSHVWVEMHQRSQKINQLKQITQKNWNSTLSLICHKSRCTSYSSKVAVGQLFYLTDVTLGNCIPYFWVIAPIGLENGFICIRILFFNDILDLGPISQQKFEHRSFVRNMYLLL